MALKDAARMISVSAGRGGASGQHYPAANISSDEDDRDTVTVGPNLADESEARNDQHSGRVPAHADLLATESICNWQGISASFTVRKLA